MSAAKMVADSTQGDFDEPRKKRKKKKEHTKKKSKKLKKKDSRKEKGSRREDEDSDLDLDKDLHPISDYIRERQDLNEQLFHCLRGPTLQRYIPDVLKDLSLEELKKRCLEHLEIMSKKRIKRILSGDDPASISSSGTDDESSEEEQEVSPQDPDEEPPEEDETEETNIEETEEPEDESEFQEAEQMSVEGDLEEGETVSDRERERSDEEEVSMESEGEVTSDESDGEIKDENDNSDDEPDEIDNDDDTNRNDGQDVERDNTEIDKNSEINEDIVEDKNKHEKLDSDDGCKLETVKNKAKQDRNESPSSSTDCKSVHESENKEAEDDNSSTEGNKHDSEIDEDKDDNSPTEVNKHDNENGEEKGDHSSREGDTHKSENDGNKGDNSTEDNDALKHVVDSTSSVEEDYSRDSNDFVKSVNSYVLKDNDSNIEENSSSKNECSETNMKLPSVPEQKSADVQKFPAEAEKSLVDGKELTSAENNPSINQEESGFKTYTEEKDVLLIKGKDSADLVENKSALEKRKKTLETELESTKKTVVLSQDTTISQITDVSDKNMSESVVNMQEDENLSRLKQEAVSSMKTDRRKIELSEKSVSPIHAEEERTRTDTRSVIFVNKTDVSSSSIKISDSAGAKFKTSEKEWKVSSSKLAHVSPSKTSEERSGPRKVIVKDSASKLSPESTAIKKLSLHASEKQQVRTLPKSSAGTSSEIVEKSLSSKTTLSIKTSAAGMSGSMTSSAKIVQKASSSKTPASSKAVLAKSSAEVSGDGALAPELTKNQMELLELEMRARAIKAMLVAHEKKEKKVSQSSTKKGK